MIDFQRPTLKSLLLAATFLGVPLIVAAPNPAAAQMAVEISVQVAPPILPVYSQPALPAYGYIWNPGYWSWTQAVGYYWVPGTWALPPVVGLLWTPPYWGWIDGAYLFHDGYWGPHVGFYGGVNYGYGYGGHGYEGGRWDGERFAYNRTVNNFGLVHGADAYTTKVIVLNNSHVSYSGGTGGLTAQPTAEERNAGQDHHLPPTAVQAAHIATAVRTPALAAAHNAGHPAIAATSHAAQFTGAGVVRAQSARASEPSTGRGGPPHPAAAPGPAHQAEQYAAEPRAPAPQGPAPQAHEQPPQHAAPAAEHAAQHPVAAPGPAHPAEQHAGAVAREPAKTNEEHKPGA